MTIDTTTEANPGNSISVKVLDQIADPSRGFLTGEFARKVLNGQNSDHPITPSVYGQENSQTTTAATLVEGPMGTLRSVGVMVGDNVAGVAYERSNNLGLPIIVISESHYQGGNILKIETQGDESIRFVVKGDVVDDISINDNPNNPFLNTAKSLQAQPGSLTTEALTAGINGVLTLASAMDRSPMPSDYVQTFALAVTSTPVGSP